MLISFLLKKISLKTRFFKKNILSENIKVVYIACILCTVYRVIYAPCYFRPSSLANSSAPSWIRPGKLVYLREIIFVITCSCFPFHFKLFIASTKGEKQTWKCCVSSLERMHWIKMPFVNYLYSSCLWSVSILDKVQQGNI